MNLLSPVLRLESGGAEVFHRVRGPVLLVAPHTAALDAAVIATALPGKHRWQLRAATGDGPLQRAQVAAGNSLLVLADLTEPWVGELLTETELPIIPVGVRGARAVGGLRDIVRRGLPRPDDRPRVAVRFGAPIRATGTPQQVAEQVAAACARLVAEDETTWWQALRTDADRPTAPQGSWREEWHSTGPMPRGGPVTRRRIWR
ncbi:hypothetical protein [Enemella sp. A6]|uniref:hypothetical protein n=1 Tax=Enemella sp. A6 TaxID=3440152 RepID=UPI003EBBC8CC